MPIQKGKSLETLDSGRVFSKDCPAIPRKPGLWRKNGNMKMSVQTVITAINPKGLPLTKDYKSVTYRPSQHGFYANTGHIKESVCVIPCTYSLLGYLVGVPPKIPKNKTPSSRVSDLWVLAKLANP